MAIYRLPPPMRLGEQMRRVRRGDTLRGKMTANVQIGGIFSLLDRLMLRTRFLHRFLLRADVIVEFSVAAFEFTSDSVYIFFHHRKFRFGCD